MVKEKNLQVTYTPERATKYCPWFVDYNGSSQSGTGLNKNAARRISGSSDARGAGEHNQKVFLFHKKC